MTPKQKELVEDIRDLGLRVACLAADIRAIERSQPDSPAVRIHADHESRVAGEDCVHFDLTAEQTARLKRGLDKLLDNSMGIVGAPEALAEVRSLRDALP